ncbi:Rho guanine nucleotide exchange factor [Marasmius crinis-equi]|uniref:Rho guanine nucleotide exchange factor n=1 Tax=Marasmius crinis-equi TaxID=585013 RepID=A0ABR3F1S4_9AGAR
MQQLTDSPSVSPEMRSKIFQAMLRLSKNSGLHPQCLEIQNVKRFGKYPINSGGFGEVWKGVIGDSSQHVCLKIVKIYYDSNIEQLAKQCLREAILWRQMKHPNVLPFLGVYKLEHDRQLCLISPWMEHGNLVQYLKTTPRENVDHYTLTHDVAAGLSYLHMIKIAHSDLKGINILITDDLRACIGDFGLSRVKDTRGLEMTPSAARPGGTGRWLARELLVGGVPSKETDMYAYGCVCLEIFTDGKQPFVEKPSDAAVILAVMEKKQPLRPEGIPDAMWTLMQSCWDANPASRPTAGQVVDEIIGMHAPKSINTAPQWNESTFTQIWGNVDHQSPEIPSLNLQTKSNPIVTSVLSDRNAAQNIAPGWWNWKYLKGKRSGPVWPRRLKAALGEGESPGGGQGEKESPETLTILTASLNLGKTGSLRRNGEDEKGQGGEAEGSTHSEAAKVEKLASELKRIEVFAQQFARDVAEWAKFALVVMRNLQVWAESFARVIGLNDEQGSEAFDAFIGVIQEGLIPLGGEMERAIQELLLGDLARLISTMRQPVKLLMNMEETEPYHHHLNMPVSAKNQPPAALLEASTNYLALRGQLAAELPTYLGLLEKGLEGALRRVTEIQTRYWMDVRDRWGELWEILRVEGEMNAGCEETVRVWRKKWGDVDEGVRRLGIVSSVVSRVYERERREREQTPVSVPVPISEQWMQSQTQKDKKGKNDKKEKDKDKDKDPMTSNTSLSSTHSHPMSPVSGSASPFSKTRDRGLSDAQFATTNTSASASSGRRDFKQRAPNSLQSQSSQKPRPRANDWDDYFPPPVIAGLVGAYGSSLPGTGMPLPKGGQPSAGDEPWKIPLPSPAVEDLFFQNEEGDRGGRVGGEGSPKRRDVEERPVPTPTASISWSTAPVKYTCLVVHACKPPSPISYDGFPFFTLKEGECFDVLHEAGHPGTHRKLPLYVDDGEDCLLLCRRRGEGEVGWALASFLEPLEGWDG